MSAEIFQFKDDKDRPRSLACKPRLRTWLRRSLWAFVIYTILGFLILPPIIRAVASKQISKELKREASIEKVRLNPYALSISIQGLKIKDPDAETLLAWDEVYVNLQLSSFLGRSWVFKEIFVLNPFVRVQLNKDRTFNFSDILAAHAGTNTAAGKSASPAKPLAVRVGRLRIDGARLSVTDLTPRNPFRRVIGPVKVAITDFRTDPNSRNPHVLTGSTEAGETFTWGGHFSTDPIGAVGEFGVENVTLNKLAPLYEDLVNFEIRDGVAGFRLNYEFLMGPTGNVVAVSNASFTLRSFKLGAPGCLEDIVEIPECSAAGVSGDLLSRRLDVGTVAIRGASLNLARERGAPFNLVEASQPNSGQSVPAGVLLLMRSATNAFAQLLGSTNLGTVTIRNVAVEDCSVTLRDNSPGRPVRLRVDQINASARNISNRPETNLVSTASLRWNTNGTVRVGVDAAMNPLDATLNLQLNKIELAPLSPYLDAFVNVYVLGSRIGLDGAIRATLEAGGLPRVTFEGSAALDDLNLVHGDTSENLLKWGALRLDGISANLNPPSVAVSNVLFGDVSALVVMETNRTLNVTTLVRSSVTNAAAGTNALPATASSSSAPGGTLKQAFAQVKSILGMETNNPFASLPKVDVAAVQVENAGLEFLDRSVTPPARAVIQNIRGTIRDISTSEMRRAQIHFEMLAGGTGPIEITGQLNPLHAKQATEAKVTFRKVKLNPADPYAVKFLGYRLTRGELGVDVEYTINASQVKGRNLIVLDQLTLGDKVASPDAVRLPVKLGIALLKDSSGKIELDVPVEGNLDDPEFRIGKVVWGVIGNIFVKAVTSPFSLLGSLVGGGAGEEMQFQEFAPGSVDLDEKARQKLAQVAKALEARPGLQIEIEGNVDSELDGDALRRARLESRLRADYWQSLRASAREKTTAEQVELVPEVRASLIARAYRDLLKTNPAEALVPARTNAAPPAPSVAGRQPVRAATQIEKGATRMLSGGGPSIRTSSKLVPGGTTIPAPAFESRPTAAQMEQALVSAVKLTDAAFADLAMRRALQVQSHLVQELKVAAERVRVSEAGAGLSVTNGHRVVLQLR